MLATSEDIFDLDVLIKDLKFAAMKSGAARNVKSILEDAFNDPKRLVVGMPEFTDNDVVLFEDDTVSIWHCRFMPGHTVPAHDHQIPATVAVYRGAERNDLYANDQSGGIKKSSEVVLEAGDVFAIGPKTTHTVTCISSEPCCGIHVYLGKLTEIERTLFDVDAGLTMPFTDENYYRLVERDATREI